MPDETQVQPASTGAAPRHWVVWLALCFSLMVAFFGPTDNWLWDPSFYYAQVRSPVIDNDLDFRDETIMSGPVIGGTPNGMQSNAWPIGPSIFWSPFFLLAHILVTLAAPAQATGFTFLYVGFVSFASVLYGALGLLIVYKSCRRFGYRLISAVAVALCLAGAPLAYYMFRQPIMAHSMSFMVSAAFVLYYIQLSDSGYHRDKSGLIFGALLGLSFLMRWSGILFAILPAVYYTKELFAPRQPGQSSNLRFTLQQVLILIVTFILTLLPQLVLWERLYGTFFIIPQAGGFVANGLPVNFLKLFFDTNRGLLFWSPFLIIGLLGVIRIRPLEIKVGFLALTILHCLLLGYRADWHGGGGYGPRYFIELLPIAAVGFACLARDFSVRPIGKFVLIGGAILLVAHQAVLIYAVEHASDGWLNLADYLEGRPLGLRWQLDAFLRLAAQPAFWLSPRPHVAQANQTILVNVAANVREWGAYAIAGTAAALTPLAVAAARLVRRYARNFRLPIIVTGVVAYIVAWAVYLMTVG